MSSKEVIDRSSEILSLITGIFSGSAQTTSLNISKYISGDFRELFHSLCVDFDYCCTLVHQILCNVTIYENRLYENYCTVLCSSTHLYRSNWQLIYQLCRDDHKSFAELLYSCIEHNAMSSIFWSRLFGCFVMKQLNETSCTHIL